MLILISVFCVCVCDMTSRYCSDAAISCAFVFEGRSERHQLNEKKKIGQFVLKLFPRRIRIEQLHLLRITE